MERVAPTGATRPVLSSTGVPNMRRPLPLLLALAAFAAPATAQTAASGATSDYGVAAIRPLYEMVKGFILASAEQMPAEQYGYKPTPEVRSFGEILGHVASDQYWFCSRVKGEPREEDESLEKLDKEHMIPALRAAFGYCDELYANLSGTRAAEMVDMGRQQRPRLFLLDYNVTHDWEHYGNLITYFRLNGMVPPSSQQGG